MKKLILLIAVAFSYLVQAGQTTFDVTVPVLYTGEGGIERPSRFVWTFESESGADVRWGYYADGRNRWVAPAVGDTGVRLVSLEDGEPSEVHFLHVDADPTPHSMGLLYTNKAVNGGQTYPNNNPAEDDLPNLPIVYTPGAAGAISLVASSERNTAEEGGGGTKAISGGAINSYCVVTIVTSPPANNGADSIRPNVSGDTKHLLDWSDFDLTRLLYVSGSGVTDSATLSNAVIRWSHSTELFSMVTWDGDSYAKFSEGGRAYRPHILHDEYSTFWAITYLSSVSYLLDETPEADKKPLLAAMLSHGLDCWAHMFDTSVYKGAYSSGAGQSSGGTNPVYLFSALVESSAYRDPVKYAVIQNWYDDSKLQGPQELRQIMRGQTGVLLWGDSHVRQKVVRTSDWEVWRRYLSEMIGWAGFDGAVKPKTGDGGNKAGADPWSYIDGPPLAPGASYMDTTYKSNLPFAALCLIWPAWLEVVNTTDPIEYVDRIHTFGRWASPDPLAIPTPEDQLSDCAVWNNQGACNDYRVTWGPTPDDVNIAFEDGAGRYESRHGEALLSYNAGFTYLGKTWSELIAGYTGPRYADRVNAVGVCAAPDIYLAPKDGSLWAYVRSGTYQATVYFEVGTSEANTPTPSVDSPIFTATPESPYNMGANTYIKAMAAKTGFADSGIAQSSGAVSAPPDPPPPSGGGDNNPKRARLRGAAQGLLMDR